MTADLDYGYTAPHVCEEVGITYRQLDYWIGAGYVRCSVQEAKGSGTRRLFSPHDVAALKLAQGMRQSGCTLSWCRRVLTFMHGLDYDQMLVTGVVVDAEGVRPFWDLDGLAHLISSAAPAQFVVFPTVWET